MPVWILKADGSREPFRPNKIRRTARRAGASPRLATKIADEVSRFVKDGTTSKDVLKFILRRLKEEEPRVACRYDLKGSILRMGIAGFTFEKFVAELLSKYSYDVKLNQAVKGACVTHEIDIVVVGPISSQDPKPKSNARFMVECKYHHESGHFTGLKEVMYTWARVQDLKAGSKTGTCDPFDQSWLITNTKFSDDAQKYASCQGVRLTGWNIPKGESLHELIENKGLYPVTVLPLDEDMLARLAQKHMLLLKDLSSLDPQALSDLLGVNHARAQRLLQLAQSVVIMPSKD